MISNVRAFERFDLLSLSDAGEELTSIQLSITLIAERLDVTVSINKQFKYKSRSTERGKRPSLYRLLSYLTVLHCMQGGVRALQLDNEYIITGSWDMTIAVCLSLFLSQSHLKYFQKLGGRKFAQL